MPSGERLMYGRAMLTPFDHLLAVLLAVLFPIRAALFGFRRLQNAGPDEVPKVRMWLYRQGIAIQWALTFGALALWAWQQRSWAALGVVPFPTWGLLGVSVGIAITVAYFLWQRRKAVEDDEALGRLRDRMRHLERMMPHSEDELRWFGWLSVTAGICEELLYRGYLVWYLATWMALIPAALIAAVVFGFGHSYQGVRGILSTTLVGVFMSAVFAVTGSLLACMVIHALMDLHAGHMLHEAFTREAPPVEPPDPPLLDTVQAPE
jgi:membrane protease YdiL (CAAX protease family)